MPERWRERRERARKGERGAALHECQSGSSDLLPLRLRTRRPHVRSVLILFNAVRKSRSRSRRRRTKRGGRRRRRSRSRRNGLARLRPRKGSKGLQQENANLAYLPFLSHRHRPIMPGGLRRHIFPFQLHHRLLRRWLRGGNLVSPFLRLQCLVVRAARGRARFARCATGNIISPAMPAARRGAGELRDLDALSYARHLGALCISVRDDET